MKGGYHHGLGSNNLLGYRCDLLVQEIPMTEMDKPKQKFYHIVKTQTSDGNYVVEHEYVMSKRLILMTTPFEVTMRNKRTGVEHKQMCCTVRDADSDSAPFLVPFELLEEQPLAL